LRKMIEGWDYIGWQGITVCVPKGWDPVVIGGTWDSGYLQIADSTTIRMEIKWKRVKGEVNLPLILDRFISEIKQRAAKKKSYVEVERDAKLIDRKKVLEKKGALTFSWESIAKAYGVVYQCPECKRVIIAQVISHREDPNALKLASWILTRMEDHPDGDLALWSAYGFSARIPKGYMLVSHEIKSGYIRLAFEGRKTELLLLRWSLANIILEKTNIKEWYVANFKGRRKKERPRFEVREWSDGPHDLVLIEGRKWRPIDRIGYRIEKLLSLEGKYFIWGKAWHCRESNKIYAVELLGGEKARGILDLVSEGITCHVWEEEDKDNEGADARGKAEKKAWGRGGGDGRR
jgi:hypothetical protein